MRVAFLTLACAIAAAMVGCCGGAPNHKCSFTPPLANSDGGADAALPCGTAVCEASQVCCVKKVPLSAMCINPDEFVSLGCEKPPDIGCTGPSDCPAGTTCCLDLSDVSLWVIACRPPPLCPEDGQSTRLSCESAADCPQTSPVCSVLASAGETDIKICGR